jgi:hypothetical protein
MSALDFPRLRQELESHIINRTGTRIRNLAIQLSPDGVSLQGETATFYVKQLAQHSVREMLPDVRLQNDIMVS